ncbi:hypothetical protein JHK87_053714 [Glycine soja]|nr:hypothetical protein JHK87_053714 [Glycine soja]
MNTRRDNRNNRVSLFDGIEEGGIRASSVYSSSHEIDEHDNEQALDGLQDRVNLLKRVLDLLKKQLVYLFILFRERLIKLLISYLANVGVRQLESLCIWHESSHSTLASLWLQDSLL